MNKRSRLLWLCIAIVVVGFTAFWFVYHSPNSKPLSAAPDLLVVNKRAHELSLYRDGQILKTYPIALGRGGIAAKQRAGDNKTPEGRYLIVAHNPHSAFHNALRVGYPTQKQVLEAHKNSTDPGGDIMVHGIRNGWGWVGRFHTLIDWTAGCVALTDTQIDEIAAAVPDGTPIDIRQ